MTWGDGVFSSSDGGTSWKETNAGIDSAFVYSLSVDHRASHTIYAGTNKGLYRSSDRGATWARISSAPSDGPVEAIAANPQTTNGIVLATNKWIPGKEYLGSVSRSPDLGKNWVTESKDLPSKRIHALVVNPKDPNTMYAGTDAGVFKSTNGGAAWNAANTGLTGMEVDALTADRENPNKLYARTSAGVFEITFAP